MHEVKEIKKGIIQTEDDITRLGFLDWRRTVRGPGHDMRHLVRWLKGNMKYTVIRSPLCDALPRDDFPDWSHVGLHVPTAQAYWNWFHSQFWWVSQKELVFSDSPDFWGSLTFPAEQGMPEHYTRFWGDIGTVSLLAFWESLFQMSPGDLWITLYDDFTQLILEARADFLEATQTVFSRILAPPFEKKPEISSYIQASLWDG